MIGWYADDSLMAEFVDCGDTRLERLIEGETLARVTIAELLVQIYLMFAKISKSESACKFTSRSRL